MIEYISDFDKLTWIIDLDEHKFYECDIPWNERKTFRNWIKDNCCGKILVWNGLAQPLPGQNGGWGDLISPDKRTAYLIFMESHDEARFVLEFDNTSMVRKIHLGGWSAYFDRILI